MSDSSSNLSKSYWNWELVWQVNGQYRELINIDPDVVPHIDKLSLTSFFAKSRKWYVADKPMVVMLATNNVKYYTTDIKKIDNSWCNDWECFYMFYQMSPDKSRYRILRRDCGECGLTIVDEWIRCSCDTTKFFNLDFPIWDVIKSGIGTQAVEEWILYKFTDDTNAFTPPADWWDVYVGDYIVFHAAPNTSNPWQCWIYRQITAIEDWYIQLDTWYNEIDEANRTGELVSYKIFRNVWKTVGWAWSSWLNIYNWWSEFTRMCWTWWACIQSVVNHNWIVNVLTDKWYNLYWGIWENIMYFSWLQSTYVWTDKSSSVSFGNFLVFLGESSVEAMVFSEDWKYSYKYDLSNMSYGDFGIFSQNAYSVFDNGLFIVWKDKRLYAASIAGSGDKYYLELKTQSELIFPDLDLLQEGDEVSLNSYQNKLYIFINGRLFDDNYNTDKTKIIIYNKDYGLRYKHIVSRGTISWTKYWLFYGDWLYQYVWDRDVYMLWSPSEDIVHYAPIKAEIVFDIVNSENHWVVNSLGNRVSLMTEKKINWMKLLLGAWVYTNNSYIEISSHMNWYKFTKKIPFVENEWFNNRIEYFNGDYDNIAISDCFADQLSSNDNMESPYEWSRNNTDIKEGLESPVCNSWDDYEIRYDSKRLDDYAICYDDKWYVLSPLEHITINPGLKFNSILYTVKVVSDWYDRLNFWWAVVEYESYPINYKNKSRYDIEINCEE
jgi:hypothetical protein